MIIMFTSWLHDASSQLQHLSAHILVPALLLLLCLHCKQELHVKNVGCVCALVLFPADSDSLLTQCHLRTGFRTDRHRSHYIPGFFELTLDINWVQMYLLNANVRLHFLQRVVVFLCLSALFVLRLLLLWNYTTQKLEFSFVFFMHSHRIQLSYDSLETDY